MRIVYLLIFLVCAGLVGYAVSLQYSDALLPCPLCVMQRLAYWLIGLTALLAFLHAPGKLGQRLYNGLIMLFAVSGAAIAGRQVWLVRFSESFECEISPEEAFLNVLPLAQWWPDMFEANGDCTDNAWQFLSLTLPDWSLIAFLSLSIVAGWLWRLR